MLCHKLKLEQLTKAWSSHAVSIMGKIGDASTAFVAILSLFTVNTPNPTSLNTRGIKAQETRFFFYCLKSLSAYTNSLISDCSCGSAVRASSTCLSFCSFSIPCFCVIFSCLSLSNFPKVQMLAKPSSTLFRFLTGRTQVMTCCVCVGWRIFF